MTEPRPDRVPVKADRLPSVAPPKSGHLTREAAAALLDRLRGVVEHAGAPFDVARRSLGVSDALDRAWRKRAAELAAKSPDLRMVGGRLIVGGSDAFEAEYARIAATADARQAAVLIGKLTEIALDDSRGAAQVAAIKMQLEALQPGLYGTRRVEAQVTAEVGPAGGGVGVDPAQLETMTPAQRAAVVDAARMLTAAKERWAAALAGAQAGAPEHVADGADEASTWPQDADGAALSVELDGDDAEGGAL